MLKPSHTTAIVVCILTITELMILTLTRFDHWESSQQPFASNYLYQPILSVMFDVQLINAI